MGLFDFIDNVAPGKKNRQNVGASTQTYLRIAFDNGGLTWKDIFRVPQNGLRTKLNYTRAVVGSKGQP